MAKAPLYPLEQVLKIKKKRVADAEKVVKEKQRLLEKEEKKLKEAQKALQKVQDHHDDKLAQIRDALDTGKKPYKVQQMKDYLKIVKEDLVTEEKKVKTQEKVVKEAEKNLEQAKKVLREKRQEVDKLSTHKEEWLYQQLKEIRRLENKQQDELGSLIYQSKKHQEKNS
jgi:flagellar biosynthesis chaperone FliJ